jgi:hypothetical protein
MQTKFTFIINYINSGYVLIAKAYNDEGDIANETEQAPSIVEILVKQDAFYNTNKTGE